MPWNLSAFADEAGNSIDEQIKALKRAGYHFVDLRGINGFNITTLPVEQARLAKQKLDAAGIRVAMFGSPLGKIDIGDDFAADLQRLRHLGELAPILDCQAVRIFSYYNKKGQPKPQWEAESLKRLKALRDEAGKLGLVLYHENESHIFGDHPEDVATIGREVRDGRTFRMIFDFSNFNIGGDDVWACWQKLKGVTDGFHLKDSDAGKQHVLLGQGAGQVKRILSEALAAGFEGPLTLEPHVAHSKAVLATGPSGGANQEFSKLPTAESFHLAAQAAKELLASMGVPLV